MQPEIIFSIVVLVVSVILHEVAHGYMANYLGDPTARLAGRLTLNPLPHVDPIGSIVLPALLAITGSPLLIGYAKPVPYNPYNLRGKFGETLVAASGPGTNLLIALLFALAIRFGAVSMTMPLLGAFTIIVYVNLVLALFNLIPIPPLDGSKVLSGILPRALAHKYDLFRVNFERLGILSGTLLVLVVFYLLLPYFSILIKTIFFLLTGLRL
jgi:Zn-dependent protease